VDRSAREAGDHLLAAAALGHTTFVSAEDRSYDAARDYLDLADRHVHKQPHPAVHSWLAAVEAEIQSNAVAECGAFTALERAEAVLTGNERAEDLPWFDYYYDSGRLSGFRGYAALSFGRTEEAITTLDAALRALPAVSIKRAVYLADIATVHVHQGEIDQACRMAAQALDSLALAGYATDVDRLRAFRPPVEPWHDHPAVRDLDDRLAVA
jgi:ATP/maltotriose-dependent transcriptional regulator MalT